MNNPYDLGGVADFPTMPPPLYETDTDGLHINEFGQHSLGWFRSRLGSFTGSCIGKLMKENRQGGFSDTAMSYIYQVAATRYMNDRIVSSDKLFGEYLEAVNVETKAMRWGAEQEAHARRLYAKRTGYTVTERGSVEHPVIPFFASSPDGFIENDLNGGKGCIEIKCPNQETYMRYRAEARDNATLKKVKPEYYWQCQSHMMCTGASWCDFVVYCPWQQHPIHVVRILPDKDDMALIAAKIEAAEKIIETLN